MESVEGTHCVVSSSQSNRCENKPRPPPCLKAYDQGWSYLECFYWTVVTFTTVGFGDYFIQGAGAFDSAVLGTCLILYVGLALLAALVGAIAEYLIVYGTDSIVNEIEEVIEDAEEMVEAVVDKAVNSGLPAVLSDAVVAGIEQAAELDPKSDTMQTMQSETPSSEGEQAGVEGGNKNYNNNNRFTAGHVPGAVSKAAVHPLPS